jgi:hypothetical protein
MPSWSSVREASHATRWLSKICGRAVSIAAFVDDLLLYRDKELAHCAEECHLWNRIKAHRRETSLPKFSVLNSSGPLAAESTLPGLPADAELQLSGDDDELISATYE